MARFYLPASEWAAPSWELRGDEAHHAAKVLRLKQGDSCVVFDGRGRAAHAVVAEPPRSSGVLLSPGEECPPAPELAHLTLCQAVPKGANMDLIIQKSVELGVSAIVPLLTDRTIVRLNAREAEAKRQKWQRIALEACKQCGQNTLPEVAAPVPFAEWLRRGAPEGLNVIASLVVYLLSGFPLMLTPIHLVYSFFFVFALMFPESQILLMMVLPLKAKWIAVAEAVIYVYDFYKGGIFTKVEILLPDISCFIVVETYSSTLSPTFCG